MIPKIIHYCWISDEKDMPNDIKKCIESWHKHLPNYKFINWNDKNFDWNICEFTKYSREHNSYAFCSDYIRFWSIYNFGGIYLDSDVFVNRPFDELLNLKRIITKEILYKTNKYYESAIIGCEKHDKYIKEVLDWYTNCNEHFEPNKYIVSPDILTKILNKYNIRCINDIKDIKNEDDYINVLDVDTYFNMESDKAFAQHNFKNSWCGQVDNCLNHKDDIKIFLCAHKPIENYIPKNNKYIILAQNKSVIDDNHKVIYMTDYDFAKTHSVCYSEGCAMRYMYEHQEILPKYVGFGHYRRMFLEFVNAEKFIPRYINRHGAIIKTPWNHYNSMSKSNEGSMYACHPKDDTIDFIISVKEAAPEYWNTFTQLLTDNYQYACNIFAMKKEHFLEMAEMCFRVLDHYDKKRGYKNNEDVYNKMAKDPFVKNHCYDVNWHSRLQGFWLEWLTELYYRQKFGVENCYITEAGIPRNAKTKESDKVINYYYN